MQRTPAQTDKLFTVHGILSKIFEYGEAEARKQGLKTLHAIREAETIFYNLRDSGSAETISAETADFYRKRKFTVKNKGIGYIITI